MSQNILEESNEGKSMIVPVPNMRLETDLRTRSRASTAQP